jgi:polygalacturonase
MGGTGGAPSTSDASALIDGAAEAEASAPFVMTCDDIGQEPVIAPACVTVLATKTTTVDGKPGDESTLDTQAIQDAIDACPPGQSVKLAADGDNNAFLSGPLSMKAGVTLWIDAGTTLFASRNPRDFDRTPGQCGLAGAGNGACSALFTVANAANVSIVGAGTVDGRGGEPVDVADGGGATWWDLEDLANGDLAAPRLVQATSSTNFTLYQLTFRNSPKFHIVIERSVGFRVWGITINTAPNSPNTDGIDPSISTNGLIAYSKISTGDDNIAIKGGGPGLVDNITIAHNHFGRGHGMSIGSETNGGVRNVRVCDLTLDGTDNGLRIKSDVSRGGLVQNIAYSDVCMRNVRNPLVFDPFYTRGAVGTLIPNYRDIFVRNTHVLAPASASATQTLTLRGYNAATPLVITFDNVVFDTNPTRINASNANITLGPGPVNFMPTGADAGVSVTQLDPASADARACGDDVWVTF